MPKVPLPHVLTFPANNSHPPRGKLIRVVTDAKSSDFLLQTTVCVGQDIRYASFVIDSILEERPAKGDWSAWEKHPTYYEATYKEVADGRTGTVSSDPDYIKKMQNLKQ